MMEAFDLAGLSNIGVCKSKNDKRREEWNRVSVFEKIKQAVSFCIEKFIR